MHWCPREVTRQQLGTVLVVGAIEWTISSSLFVTAKKSTYVRLSKRALSSSRRNWISSTMSSSVHLRPDRFFENGKSCATSIAGRFACGALETRFYIREHYSSAERERERERERETEAAYPERRNDHSDNLLLRSTLSNIDKKGYNVESPRFRKRQNIE